jgi:hypothetical protein
MPIQIWILILPQALQMLENKKNIVDFYAAMPIYAVSFSHCHRCHTFQYSGQYINIFWKKYRLALHLVEMGSIQDTIWIRTRQKMKPIRQHTDQQH